MTDVPLREYMESKVAALDRLFERQLAEIRDATALALKTIPTKEDIDRRMSEIEKRQAFERGRTAVSGAIAGAVSGAILSGLMMLVVYLVTR